ncbi:ThiF family adenylyltransferase [Paenibacillus nanensis]|uniref:ThiF family adenylyltransferase n=1 Tax=Paenibacillus nanensis TaxID=393251 RepID=A0A3A1VFG6_9BACL|nr:ThiF family adenylyltransferase [Paenibacillus nanensis]RIX59649.1 ThiF family adenylyltransferase [Paenibacillus nanensis]
MKPKLKDFYRNHIQVSDQVIRIRTDLARLEIPDPDGIIYGFMNQLTGRHTIEELAGLCNLTEEDVRRGVSMLHNHKLLESDTTDTYGLTERELQRYRNNFTYYSVHESRLENRYLFQDRLKNSSVAILGLGGGGLLATWLTAMGVGRIVGVDHDRVELNNLNRQILFTEDDVGKRKTDVVRERLQAMNRDINIQVVNRQIDSAHSVKDIIADVDVVVCVIDTPPVQASRYVNSACMQYRKPAFHAGLRHGSGFLYRVVPFETGCTDCLCLQSIRRNSKVFETIKSIANGELDSRTFLNPSFAPNVSLLTSVLASEIAKYLTKHSPMFPLPYTKINLQDMSFTHEEINRIEDCPSCGRSRVIGAEPGPLDALVTLGTEKMTVK